MVRKGQNIRAEVYLMAKITLKSMRVRSIYITIKKLSREGIFECIISHPDVNPSCVSSDVIMIFKPE